MKAFLNLPCFLNPSTSVLGVPTFGTQIFRWRIITISRELVFPVGRCRNMHLFVLRLALERVLGRMACLLVVLIRFIKIVSALNIDWEARFT